MNHFRQISWQLCHQEDKSLQNVEKPCISMWSVLSSGFFSVFFVSISLVCVVPLTTTWTFVSNLKALALSGLSVWSLQELWISYQNHSSIRQSHPCYHSAQHPITWILDPLRHHCQYEKVFFDYCLFFNSLRINLSLQLTCLMD